MNKTHYGFTTTVSVFFLDPFVEAGILLQMLSSDRCWWLGVCRIMSFDVGFEDAEVDTNFICPQFVLCQFHGILAMQPKDVAAHNLRWY